MNIIGPGNPESDDGVWVTHRDPFFFEIFMCGMAHACFDDGEKEIFFVL